MNITVYLGANAGNDPALAQATAELGRWIGESGNTLVYGGSASGLMGVLAKSVLGAGGKAIGVEPQFFIDEGYEFDGLTELIVTRDMSERKAKMIELGEAFIALPGGTGTLEEITEVMSNVAQAPERAVHPVRSQRVLRAAARAAARHDRRGAVVRRAPARDIFRRRSG